MRTSRQNKVPGKLYVVATPLGNMADITYRAVEILGQSDLIAAEDTRRTARLLSHYNIDTPLISCHEYNEEQRSPLLIEKISTGSSIALVSDAGTPMVSDPGYRLVRAALKEGIQVVPIPGPCAAIAALCASGLEVDGFCFAGFVPKKKKSRQQMLSRLAEARETVIFYESPKRIIPLLENILAVFGNRQAVMAREITKRHEEFLRGSIDELLEDIGQRETVKGEITLLVSAKSVDCPDSVSDGDGLKIAIRAGLDGAEASPSRLAADLAKKFQMPKSYVYKLILDMSNRG
jgi:16S rRNA (cytidine1402-2'-O)-methyltransferase